MRGEKRISSLFVISALLILFCAVEGIAQDKTFYNRKVIEIIVATKVGGGYDTDARLIAPFLQEQLPGSTVIVRNVPGGGHIVGANRVWNAPPNGLTIGVANVPGLIASQIRGEKGIQFDLRKFTWLGRLYSRHRFLIARSKAGFDTIEALMKGDKEFKIGCAGVGDGPYNTGLLTAEALGLKKVRMIPNYGGNEEMMGMMRKEIEGVIGGLESWNELIDQGVAIPIVSFDAKRYSGLPNTPTLAELAKTPGGKAIAGYVAGESELSRAIFAPPDLPNNIAQTLQQALLKALQNEKLKEMVSKMKREAFDPLPGEDVSKKVGAALNLPQDVAELIKKVARAAE
jgi:tripartite-type tricarboxylate transporter receptor subunit TctC